MKTINESFECEECKQIVPKAKKTCRNHCLYCFCSKHVDGDIPWDRSTECHGKMYPIEYKTTNWMIKILFKCVKCWKQHWNKSLDDDEIWDLEKNVQNYKKYFIE